MALASVINRDATSITTTSATLKGDCVDTGGLTTTITLFYGLTDGVTTAGDWDHSVAIPSFTVGVDYSTAVSGLLPGRVYYFTSRAHNSDGDAWVSGGGAGS